MEHPQILSPEASKRRFRFRERERAMKEKHIGKRSCAINFRLSLLICTLQFDLMAEI
jgi:hypothetical protein